MRRTGIPDEEFEPDGSWPPQIGKESPGISNKGCKAKTSTAPAWLDFTLGMSGPAVTLPFLLLWGDLQLSPEMSAVVGCVGIILFTIMTVPPCLGLTYWGFIFGPRSPRVPLKVGAWIGAVVTVVALVLIKLGYFDSQQDSCRCFVYVGNTIS